MKILLSSTKGFLREGAGVFGGVENFTSMFIPYWKKSKHSFIAFDFRPPKNKKVSLTFRTKSEGKNRIVMIKLWIPGIEILNLLQGKHSAETELIVQRLTQVIIQEKPDLFFLNGFILLFYVLMVAAKRASIPIVAVHHGVWNKEIKAVNDEQKIFTKKGLRLRRDLEREIIHFAQRNIFLNSVSAGEFEKYVMPVPKKQLRYISLPYNPMFLNKTLPKPKTVNPEKQLVIGMVGRWDAVKNFPAFISLAKEASKQKLPWKFLAVTKVNPSPWLKEHLKGLHKFVEIVDPMSPVKLKKFYQRIDLLVMPSHFETFGGVAMEALLQNKPVLLSPTVGWGDTLKNYKLNDWIMPFGDSKKVITRIKKISVQTPPKRLLNDIIKYNHPDYVFKQYEKVFKEVLK